MKRFIGFLAGVSIAGMLAAPASGQTVLSDFSTDVDSWSGAISGNTPFANGSTAVTQVDESGNGVLNLSDGGFGGGASRTYAGAATAAGFITIGANLKIVTDPGNLVGDAAFGARIGGGTGAAPDFAYSKSVGTGADDSGQSFQHVAVALRVDAATTDVVCAVTPDKADWSVAGGTWVMRLDNVRVSTAGTEVSLDTFDSTVGTWASTSASNSPWAAGSTAVSWADETGNGVVNISDGGFAGGAVGTYAGALPGEGVHTAVIDLKVVTDPGTLTGAANGAARIAASAGATTNAADLSWSQSFATGVDDSGQAFASYAIPVVTTGASDLAVYVVPDFDASVAGGTWVVRVDNVRVYTSQQVPVDISLFSIE